MNANVWTGTAGGLRIRVQACGESILRIIQTANPSFRNRDYNITTGECPLTEAVISETAESCRICAGQLSLTLCKKTGGMTLSDAQGKCYGTIGPCTLSPVEVTRNSWEHAVVEESSGIDGARAAAEGSQAVFDRIGFRGEMPLSFGEEEGIFGFGSFEEGYGNLRGKKRYIYQQNMRACVPMLVSTLGYGILFNCGCSMVFDDRDTHTLTLDCVDELDVYFMGGGSHQAVLENYYRLTGRPPMLPKYIFGYIQSKERYTCARELIQVLSEYRRWEIPLDVIVQDWMTWEDGQWGQKSFDPARYPDPAAMTEEIHRQHGRLMLWICIQFYMFPRNFMSTSYFIFGFLQAVTGYMAWVFCRQESFTVSEGDYPNVGTNPRRLVVYFSRMGYTRKLALEEANRTGAMVYEIRATERTAGTLGFWWRGRFGMHRWPMPIEEIPLELTQFDHVTVCSPIWVFHLASPVRAFCQAAEGDIREADYVLVHHQKNPYWNTAREMDRLLGLRDSPAVSVCCREGRYRCRQRNNQIPLEMYCESPRD